MKQLVLILVLGIFHQGFTQDFTQYKSLINEAWKLYQAEDYLQSAKTYKQKFAALGDKSISFWEGKPLELKHEYRQRKKST